MENESNPTNPNNNPNTSANLTILEHLRRGITLARNGDRTGANAMFDAVLAQRPDHEQALVWKAAIVENPDEAVRYLEKALRINPNNQRARIGLDWAYKRQKAQMQGEPLEPFSDLGQSNPVTSAPPIPMVQPRSGFQPVSNNSFPGSEVSEREEKPVNREANIREKPFIAARGPEAETKSETAPYKRNRLQPNNEGRPALKLPPEALPWTRPENPPPNPALRSPRAARLGLNQADSPVFRAASPRVAFTAASQVRKAERKGGQSAQRFSQVRLRWPLLLFGLGLGLALLAFVLNGLAPLLGGLALLAAIAGVILFNRVQL